MTVITNTKNRESYNPLLCNCYDSDKLNSVSVGAETLYYRLLAQSDDNANYHGSPFLILCNLYAKRAENRSASIAKVKGWRDELVTATLLTRYEYGPNEYIHINDCYKRLRSDVKLKIRFPDIVQGTVIKGLTVHVTDPARTRPEHVAPSSSSSSTTTTDMCLFDNFWEAYPKCERKIKKELCRQWWMKNTPDEELTHRMVTGLEWQKKTKNWTKDNGAYIPLPTTWLNQKGWEDAPEDCVPTKQTRPLCIDCGKPVGLIINGQDPKCYACRNPQLGKRKLTKGEANGDPVGPRTAPPAKTS